MLDHESCYRAVASRDRRFDGVFYTAVRTTKIYCRPSCPAITPRSGNVEFYPTAGAAQRAGFRACKRCIPDASPGSPEWDLRGDTVGRAMQLIDDGLVDREGVAGLADRLGYSARQLNRVLNDELGAGALAIARARRAHTARSLIEATTLSLTDVAFAAGFGSLRQFNETIRSVYAATPSELRIRSRPRSVAVDANRGTSATAISIHLAAREPFASRELFEFLAARAIPGVEVGSSGHYARTLDLPHGHAVVHVRPSTGSVGVDVTAALSDLRDLTPLVRRLRRLLDLDADPVAIIDTLGTDPSIGPLVTAHPGLRAPGSADPWETVVRAIVGQQVSVAAARTVTAGLVARCGEPVDEALVSAAQLSNDAGGLCFVFPAPDRVADAPREVFSMPNARAETLSAAASAIADGEISFDVDRATLIEQLRRIRGIGPWTADYVAMRATGDPDVMLATDLGVRQAVERGGIDLESAASWAPWRSYATHYLWHSLAHPTADRPTPDRPKPDRPAHTQPSPPQRRTDDDPTV